ncbi:MAG: hypothetical protein ACOCP8_01090 [archaeon]
MEPRKIIILTVAGAIISIAGIIIYLKTNNVNYIIPTIAYIFICAKFILGGKK